MSSEAETSTRFAPIQEDSSTTLGMTKVSVEMVVVALIGNVTFGVIPNYQRKWAKARFACAILWVSSRFLIALP